MENNELKVCKSCGFTGYENYCGRCGLPYQSKRISISNLLHDIFHLFTHLDKGFGYTVKMLTIAPGYMQRQYIEGDRVRHQKPFSMFLICATVAALVRYWIFQVLITYYHIGNVNEANFFHEYMVIFHALLLPFHALIVYILFYRSGYNYAEMGVFVLYSVAFFFLVATCITLLKFIFPQLDTAYVEFPFLIVYNTITYINFFHRQSPWIVAVKSILVVGGIFLLIQAAEDYIIKLL